jgi:hypothetical protein
MAILLIELSGAIQRFPLERPMLVGRSEANDVAIDHPTLSKHHARLEARDGTWFISDLKSSNGTRVSDEKVRDATALTDGCAIRFGRVRAWFFETDPPADWQPDASTVQGVQLTCKCGTINWAPNHAAGLQLKCRSCKRRVVVETQPADCAACHGPIAPGDRSHTCPECNIAHHADCWTENRGCATYGCAQVNCLDRTESSAVEIDTESPDDVPFESEEPIDRRTPIAAITLTGLLGLPSFGVPALLAAAVLFKKGRRGFAIAGVCVATVGILVSGVWWLHWFR